ncbi:unnamed protein product [Acanthoscelides obtectus]|uniref:F-box domain-containing protein n=1 Tax=Acanthoscelides obtectus TaxID=200917 RepID=A0A9P0MG25_ACAOB|nr:unnamed protein product [Acanthoscelides obtectus]CAK1638912.1 F-box only protein 36 [Acanthoscelides obtectus]
MTSLPFPKTPILLQLYARAKAPSRDYYGLTITERNILLHAWKITHGPHAYPRTKFSDIDDFKCDKYLHEELKNVFGDNVMEYLYDLAYSKRNLSNLPPNAFLNIVQYLTANDIFRLARTSKIFHELCNTDSVWNEVFTKVLKRKPSPEEKKMAKDMGWKQVLRKRLAYIKRIYAERTQSQTRTNMQAVKSAAQMKPVRPAVKKVVEQKHVKPVTAKTMDQEIDTTQTEKVVDQKTIRPSSGQIGAQKMSMSTQSKANLAKKAPVKTLDQRVVRTPASNKAIVGNKKTIQVK